MSPKTILVVDDEASIRKLLARALRRDGVEVITAATAERLLEHRRVDLVLCDNQMLGESGLAFLGRLKGLCPDMKRVLITGKLDDLVSVTALDRAQLHDCFFKPFMINEMRERVSDLLQGETQQRPRPASRVEAEVGPAARDYIPV